MVIIGVSGGPDSMALLDLLRLNKIECVVAHVNYHYRKDSDLDENVVADYCHKYHLKLCILHHRGDFVGNFEASARDFRYRFFKDLAEVYHTNYLFVGHHQDDLLETILMQIERNSAVSYLGIQPVSEIYGLICLRPFLSFTKEQIMMYCDLKGISYRHDYTNFDCHYQRNYYRQQLQNMSLEDKRALLAKAKLYNENKKEKIGRIASVFTSRLDGKMLDISHLDDDMLYLVLDYYLRNYLQLNSKRISAKLLKECLKMMKGSKKNAKTTLFEGYFLVKENQKIHVTKAKKEINYSYIYDGSGLLETPYFKLGTSGHQNEGVCIKDDDLPLTIRNFRPGDKMQLSYGTKKLSRLFIDAKISPERKMTWPIVLNCRQEIILVPKIAKNKDYLMEKPSLYVLQ